MTDKEIIDFQTEQINKLEEQIEKMKCCCNCKKWYKEGVDDSGNYPCYHHECNDKCSIWEMDERK